MRPQLNERINPLTGGSVRVRSLIHPGLTLKDYCALRERQAKVRRAAKEGLIVLVIIALAVCMMVL